MIPDTYDFAAQFFDSFAALDAYDVFEEEQAVDSVEQTLPHQTPEKVKQLEERLRRDPVDTDSPSRKRDIRAAFQSLEEVSDTPEHRALGRITGRLAGGAARRLFAAGSSDEDGSVSPNSPEVHCQLSPALRESWMGLVYFRARALHDECDHKTQPTGQELVPLDQPVIDIAHVAQNISYQEI